MKKQDKGEVDKPANLARIAAEGRRGRIGGISMAGQFLAALRSPVIYQRTGV